jgi:hypothetical protein
MEATCSVRVSFSAPAPFGGLANAGEISRVSLSTLDNLSDPRRFLSLIFFNRWAETVTPRHITVAISQA